MRNPQLQPINLNPGQLRNPTEPSIIQRARQPSLRLLHKILTKGPPNRHKANLLGHPINILHDHNLPTLPDQRQHPQNNRLNLNIKLEPFLPCAKEVLLPKHLHNPHQVDYRAIHPQRVLGIRVSHDRVALETALAGWGGVLAVCRKGWGVLV